MTRIRHLAQGTMFLLEILGYTLLGFLQTIPIVLLLLAPAMQVLSNVMMVIILSTRAGTHFTPEEFAQRMTFTSAINIIVPVVVMMCLWDRKRWFIILSIGILSTLMPIMGFIGIMVEVGLHALTASMLASAIMGATMTYKVYPVFKRSYDRITG